MFLEIVAIASALMLADPSEQYAVTVRCVETEIAAEAKSDAKPDVSIERHSDRELNVPDPLLEFTVEEGLAKNVSLPDETRHALVTGVRRTPRGAKPMVTSITDGASVSIAVVAIDERRVSFDVSVRNSIIVALDKMVEGKDIVIESPTIEVVDFRKLGVTPLGERITIPVGKSNCSLEFVIRSESPTASQSPIE